jgi:hypothetical protein
MLAKILNNNPAAIRETTTRTRRIHIGIGKTHTLVNCEQVIEVRAGEAWISYNGKDVLLSANEPMTVKPSSYPAVVSASHFRRAVTIEVTPVRKG